MRGNAPKVLWFGGAAWGERGTRSSAQSIGGTSGATRGRVGTSGRIGTSGGSCLGGALLASRPQEQVSQVFNSTVAEKATKARGP